MAEAAPSIDGVMSTSSLTLAGGGLLVWVRGADLASAGGKAAAAAAAVLQRAHRSGTGYG
jgi:hypothetical protein